MSMLDGSHQLMVFMLECDRGYRQAKGGLLREFAA
jgi:hypothetical protein